jgi:FtsZ-binding cell division protein ZapB
MTNDPKSLSEVVDWEAVADSYRNLRRCGCDDYIEGSCSMCRTVKAILSVPATLASREEERDAWRAATAQCVGFAFDASTDPAKAVQLMAEREAKRQDANAALRKEVEELKAHNRDLLEEVAVLDGNANEAVQSEADRLGTVQRYRKKMRDYRAQRDALRKRCEELEALVREALAYPIGVLAEKIDDAGIVASEEALEQREDADARSALEEEE